MRGANDEDVYCNVVGGVIRSFIGACVRYSDIGLQCDVGISYTGGFVNWFIYFNRNYLRGCYMETMEIFFSDLSERAKKKVLKFYGLDSAEDGNLDLIAILEVEAEETGDDT